MSESKEPISGEPTPEVRIPDGYKRMPEGLGFGDRLQPLYRRIDGRDVSFGFVVGPQHVNLMGICHGGALMTLADIAAATSLHLRRDKPAPSPTINLSFDFQSPGRAGRWLHTRADHVDPRRQFGFCTGVILDGDKIVLRYSGTFYHAADRVSASAAEQAKAMSILTGDDAPFA
jgi:uncharacterized protein (TIGR00369 family)